MEKGKTAPQDQSAPMSGVEIVRGERTVSSAELFGGGRHIVIEHEGERYRLQCTSKGKLILTK